MQKVAKGFPGRVVQTTRPLISVSLSANLCLVRSNNMQNFRAHYSLDNDPKLI